MKQKLKNLLSKASGLFKRLLVVGVVLGVIANLVLLYGMLLMAYSYQYGKALEQSKVYKIDMIIGGMPMSAFGRFIEHNRDGSLCFVTEDDKRACLKAEAFIYTEINIK